MFLSHLYHSCKYKIKKKFNFIEVLHIILFLPDSLSVMHKKSMWLLLSSCGGGALWNTFFQTIVSLLKFELHFIWDFMKNSEFPFPQGCFLKWQFFNLEWWQDATDGILDISKTILQTYPSGSISSCLLCWALETASNMPQLNFPHTWMLVKRTSCCHIF